MRHLSTVGDNGTSTLPYNGGGQTLPLLHWLPRKLLVPTHRLLITNIFDSLLSCAKRCFFTDFNLFISLTKRRPHHCISRISIFKSEFVTTTATYSCYDKQNHFLLRFVSSSSCFRGRVIAGFRNFVFLTAPKLISYHKHETRFQGIQALYSQCRHQHLSA